MVKCCCTPKDCSRWFKRRIYNCWVGCLIPNCEYAGLCKCPHGCCYTIMGVMGGFGASWMNMYVVASCKFQRITELNPVTGEPIESTRRGYGMLAREITYGDTQDYRGCILYPEEEKEFLFDWWRKWSRNFAFLGGLLGLIVWVLLILAFCFKFTPWTWERWAMWAYIWASICMAMTMLMYGSDFCSENKCKVANGTGYAISAFMTYLMMANQVMSMAKPQRTPEAMVRPGSREDDYWYNGENDRFYRSDSDENDDDDKSEDDNDDDQFDDEYDHRKEGKFQNERPALMPGPNDGLPDTSAYDDVQSYMANEQAYTGGPQDPNFMQADRARQPPPREHVQPPALALPPSSNAQAQSTAQSATSGNRPVYSAKPKNPRARDPDAGELL